MRYAKAKDTKIHTQMTVAKKERGNDVSKPPSVALLPSPDVHCQQP
ncbi:MULTISPECIES: hypothetical protein [unclassified Synechocystis]|nr:MULTISPECIES: hypothetical protein [unclassified Synechocystis]MBD2617257.1 hypothetical protein [Synechocystis sp. FACHB-898]MBD2639689.1 hypothetical protein [Synechocystis sp. FACHB-908]MBD2660020.1 hypothetical protein [Synechocystis sp. FACHB-929]NHL97765.1 hypothetical protein [Synechocystis sp. PCC 6803]QWO81125.1 hypothetical protein KBZ93_03065 [Synechocystis sp. PCC 6803]